MKNEKARLVAISGAALALMVAGTAAVAAHPGNDDGRRGGHGAQRGGFGAQRGLPGDRSALRDLRGGLGDFERRETTVQTTAGTSSNRVEQGTATSVSDTALEFTLGSGEAVSVVINEDTQAIEFSEETVEGRRGFARERMVPSEIEVGGIEAGVEVVVWSDSEDGADFVASRVVVQPAASADETPDASETADDAEATDATDDAAVAPVIDA